MKALLGRLTPPTIAGVVIAVVGCAVAFGVPVTHDQSEHIVQLTALVSGLLLGTGAVHTFAIRPPAPTVERLLKSGITTGTTNVLSTVKTTSVTPFRGRELGTRTPRRYGFKPGLPGVLSVPANLAGLVILPEVDLRAHLPAVFDQGQLGSCTANATAAAFQLDAVLDGHRPGNLARLWIYYQERRIEGVLGQGDTGAYGHDAFIAAATVGVPPEKAWPYDVASFEGPPPELAVAEEGHYKLTKPVHAVAQSETAIKQVLSNRQAIAFGFTVYESFESAEVAKSGIVPMPARGEEVLGGHEVLIVGYLSAYPDHVLCRNSWGKGWGLAGYFLMPLPYVCSRSLASDLRTIVRPLGA